MQELEEKALEFIKNSEFEKAAKIYLQLALDNPDDDERFLVSAANCCDSAGDKKVALGLYKKVLEKNPQSLMALLNISSIYYEFKKYDKAYKFASDAIAIKKDNFSAMLILGNVYYAKGNYQDALAYYEAMYKLNSNSYLAILNIANTSYSMGDFIRAIEFGSKAIKKRPHSSDAYVIVGNSYIELSKPENAVKFLQKAAELSPSSSWVCNSISSLFQKQGNWKQGLHYAWKAFGLKNTGVSADDHINFGYTLYEAIEAGHKELVLKYAAEWLKKYGNNSIVKFICSAISNEQNVSKTNLEYVACLFDGFAPSFDNILMELDYKVPELISEMLGEHLKTKLFKKRRILDIGCGTGLCVEAMRKFFPNEEYYGVDVSERMLETARRKEIYAELYLNDAISFLGNDTNVYHAVIAGDVLTYIGDLRELFREVSRVVKFNGLFCFSISKNTHNNNDYFLTPSGRFVHTISYILKLLKYCGFELVIQREEFLRHEGSKDIRGYVVLARKAIEVVFE